MVAIRQVSLRPIPIYSYYQRTTTAATTIFYSISSDRTGSATVGNMQSACIRSSGFSALIVRVDVTSLTAGSTVTYHLNIDGLDGNMSIEFAEGETGVKRDVTNSDSVQVAQLLCFSAVALGVGTNALKSIGVACL